MISVLLFLTGLLCIIALIFFNKSTLKQITTTEKEVDTMSEQLTAKRDEVKQAVNKYATAIDTVQSNIDRMKQKQQTASQKIIHTGVCVVSECGAGRRGKCSFLF